MLEPVYRRDAGNVIVNTNAIREQLIADFPSEHGWILQLVGGDCVHDRWRGHLRFRPPDDASLEASRFVVSGIAF